MPEVFIFSRLLTQSKEIVHGFGTRHPPLFPGGFCPAILNQVHGSQILVVSKHGPQGDGDGMLTQTPRIALAIKTADCVPVLFYDEKKKVVGAIHSGWKGLYNEVIVQALKKTSEDFGSDLNSIKVSIGPCIEVSCYEIGIDVVEKFKERFKWWKDIIDIKDKRFYLNLRKGVTLQLIRAGVNPNNVDQIELCTFCHSELFYSWRRDGKKRERMYSFIGIK